MIHKLLDVLRTLTTDELIAIRLAGKMDVIGKGARSLIESGKVGDTRRLVKAFANELKSLDSFDADALEALVAFGRFADKPGAWKTAAGKLREAGAQFELKVADHVSDVKRFSVNILPDGDVDIVTGSRAIEIKSGSQWSKLIEEVNAGADLVLKPSPQLDRLIQWARDHGGLKTTVVVDEGAQFGEDALKLFQQLDVSVWRARPGRTGFDELIP